MRQIGIFVVLAMLGAVTARADDAKKPCLGSFNGYDKPSENPSPNQQLLLTDNQCEAVEKRELRVPLLSFEQDGEDPMTLSLGAKNIGGILRFKIPFSF
ncbi:MAG TPA: hypothetical protein VH835_05710 [Dongiaceae bacterium]|jgi:hypothetical protein